jgi:uncharacterized protein (TIGR03435 family)
MANVLWLIPLVLMSAHAQTTTFEVASVRATQHGRTVDGWSRSSVNVPSPGNFVATNASLDELIRWAYQLREYQLEGPAWLNEDSECFDILAKASPSTSTVQMRLMAQSLLAERFGLKLHRNLRVVPGLALVTTKQGLKSQPAKQDAKAGITWMGPQMSSAKVSMENFANSLARQMKQVVVDRTGIQGSFEIAFEYGPDETGPSMFSAIQSLGLRFESAKVPIEVVVIDRIEKAPTEN